MIHNGVLTEGLLQQATAELAVALNESLPLPNECQQKFSDDFEEKMRFLIKGMGTKCYAVVIQDSVLHK